MTWVQGIVAYVILWWLVIFAVLPFGIEPAKEGDPGHAAGAPANPRLLRKAAVTTFIAALLWLILYAVIRAGIISFRPA